MDILTHTAVGLFLGRAGLKRFTPLAAPVLLVAANAPDLDVLAWLGGPLAYLRFHRHLTHSLAAAPLVALAAVALVRLVARKPLNWLGAWAIALVAVLSHLLLDLTNTYGVRLLLPFSERWIRWDLTAVVDLWIWAALAVCLAAPFLSRLVGSEISSGSVRNPHHGRGFAVLALAFLLAYNGGRAALHQRALAELDSRLYRGLAPERIAALPDSGNPLHWQGIVVTSAFAAEVPVQLSREFDPREAVIFFNPPFEPALEIAARAPAVAEFLRFSRFPFWTSVPDPGGADGARMVEVFDLRFGSPRDPGFRAQALVSASGRLQRAGFTFGTLRVR